MRRGRDRERNRRRGRRKRRRREKERKNEFWHKNLGFIFCQPVCLFSTIGIQHLRDPGR